MLGKNFRKINKTRNTNVVRSRVSFNVLCICVHLFSDNMVFNLTSHNDSLLVCEVNVTQHRGLVLSIFHDGDKQSVDRAPGAPVAALPYVTLSETISLRSGGKYECRLHLDEHLITKSLFHYNPLGNHPPPQPVSFSCIHLC